MVKSLAARPERQRRRIARRTPRRRARIRLRPSTDSRASRRAARSRFRRDGACRPPSPPRSRYIRLRSMRSIADALSERFVARRPRRTLLGRAMDSPPSSTIARPFGEGEPVRRGRRPGERAVEPPRSPKPTKRASWRRARLRARAWGNRLLPKCGLAPHLRAAPTEKGGFTATVILYYLSAVRPIEAGKRRPGRDRRPRANA